VTGEYFHHKRLHEVLPATRDIKLQDRLLSECARLSGVLFPE
jgi:hypothetical protein